MHPLRRVFGSLPQRGFIKEAYACKEPGRRKGWRAAAAAVNGDSAEVTEGAEEVAKTIANSIPTKTFSSLRTGGDCRISAVPVFYAGFTVALPDLCYTLPCKVGLSVKSPVYRSCNRGFTDCQANYLAGNCFFL